MVWQVSFADLVVDTNDVSNFLDIIQRAQQDRSRFALFAWMTSLIWMRRNKLWLEEDTFPLAKISFLACKGLQEYLQLHPIHTKIPRTARSVRWHPPPSGLIKVNFDGAFFVEENKVGLGIIICNDNRLVMAALTQQIPLPASVEMVEVLAARHALWFAKELGFQRLVVESVSEVIINSINGGNMTQFEFGHILQDITFLCSFLSHVSFQHIKREGNCVAHRLARRAITNPLDVWMKSVPLDMIDVYNFDLRFSNQ